MIRIFLNLVKRFWAHLVMAYAFTFWTCYVLMKEYEKIAAMRLSFLQSEKRRADQFTVKIIVFINIESLFAIWSEEIVSNF